MKSSFKVFSILGQQLFEETLNDNNKFNIDLSNFSNGTYIINISTDGFTFDELILKN